MVGDEMVTFADYVFDYLEKALEDMMTDNSQIGLIKQLSDFYWDSWHTLKDRMGTSAGWPWFGEYMIFSVVKKYIETVFGLEFKTSKSKRHGSTKDIRIFVDDENNPKLFLGHNALIPKTIGNGKLTYRPDVQISHRGWKDGRLVFVADAKVLITGRGSFIETIRKLNAVMEDDKLWEPSLTDRQCYLISLEKGFGIRKDRLPKDVINSRVKIVGPLEGKLEERNEVCSLQDCLSHVQQSIRSVL